MKKLLLCVAVAAFVLLISRTQSQTEPQKVVLPLYYPDGRAVADAHIVIGQVTVPLGADPLVNGVPVTLSGAAAFSKADSYKCFVSETLSGPNPERRSMFTKKDGSHFEIHTFGHERAWPQSYLCIGN